jgi:RHS repeat-associated protein
VFTTKRHYTLDKTVVAVRDSAGAGSLNYLLGDQLGSTTVSINAAGGTPVVQRYLPYGAPRSTTGGSAVTDRGWIGQTKDGSTGLQYLNARYYDPQIGRFSAVDPIVSGVGSLDRFGYGLDNPVTLKDPTGLKVCDDPRECKALNVNPSGRPLGGGGGASPRSSTFGIPKTAGIGIVRVNLFIMAKEVGGPLHYRGDGRGFSSTAGCSQSRACIVLDFDRGVGTLGVNFSCRTSGSCFSPWAINGNVNKFSVSEDGGGGFSLSLSAKHADTGFAEDINPLKIDFSLSFDPASRGMTVYDAGNGEQDLSAEHTSPVLSYSGERFPSMEIYQDHGGSTYTLAQRRESSAIGGVPDGLSGTLGFLFGDHSGRVALSGPPLSGSA